MFFDNGDYFSSTGRDAYMIKREKSFMDNVTPSGNSMTVFNLLRLSDFFFDLDLREAALALLMKFPKEVKSYPSEFVQALMAYDYVLSKPKQIAIISGEGTEQLIASARKSFRPHQILAVSSVDETQIPLLKDRPSIGTQATAYVCVRSYLSIADN